MLICPICKKELSKIDNSYKCINNHSFDINKKGYTNLLLNHPNSGDNKDMVNARLTFLNKGYYNPLKEEINKLIIDSKKEKVLDLGCGVGYYTNELKNKIYGIDISKEAIIKASQNKNNLYFVASANNIPFEKNSFDIVLSIFAPIFESEIIRILNDSGLLIIVTPGIYHLIELKELLYSNPYLNNEKNQKLTGFSLFTKSELKYQKNILKEDIINLVKMTPYFYKTNKDDLLKIQKDLSITIDFNIEVYKKSN